ncbi:MAG: type IV pilin protein [Steroidobacteraceae bacterium]
MPCTAHSRRAAGVTLTEILVVLVVLAILIAVAIPAYRHYVIRANRGDARRDLVALAVQMQRCFERAGDYRHDAAGSSSPCLLLPQTNAEGTYAVSFADGLPTASSFRLVAKPRGEQVADAGCGALTLDEKGQRGVTGSDPPEECWREPGD